MATKHKNTDIPYIAHCITCKTMAANIYKTPQTGERSTLWQDHLVQGHQVAVTRADLFNKNYGGNVHGSWEQDTAGSQVSLSGQL